MTPDALPLAHGSDTWTGTIVSLDYDVALLLQAAPAGKEPVRGGAVLACKLPSDIAVSASPGNRCTEAAGEVSGGPAAGG
jgi:arylsulfatase A